MQIKIEIYINGCYYWLQAASTQSTGLMFGKDTNNKPQAIPDYVARALLAAFEALNGMPEK